MTPSIARKREMFGLGEYFATGKPGGDGGDLLGDRKLGDAGVDGYPASSKILRSGDFFVWAAIAAFIATLLAAKAGDMGGEAVSKILRSGDCFSWANIAAFIAILLAAKVGDKGELEVTSLSLAGVEKGVAVGYFSKVSGGSFFFFFFLGGDLVGSSLSSVVSRSRLGW